MVQLHKIELHRKNVYLSGVFTLAFEITLLAAKSQWAQESQTTDGNEGNGDGSGGDSSTAETSVRDGRLDGAG
jgi:hypothetical protein